jgi:ubiquinone/menaquinone biosynthesis C-methylase UbiE
MSRRVQRLASLLAERIPRDLRVLDVGAGSGELAAAVMQLRPDLTIEGIDVLVRPETRIPVRHFDGKTINEPDDGWDLCLLIDVLHHCDDPEGVIREAKRVARRGVFIKDHIADSRLDHATLRFMDWVGNRGHGVVLPYNYLSSQQWREIFARLGLESSIYDDRLMLYPLPFRWIFDRRLHFVSLVVPSPGISSSPQ